VPDTAHIAKCVQLSGAFFASPYGEGIPDKRMPVLEITAMRQKGLAEQAGSGSLAACWL